MPKNETATIDPIDREIIDLLGDLTNIWVDLDPEPWPDTRQTALMLLVWSGVAQVRLDLAGTWPDGRRVAGQALVWGQWQKVAKQALWDAGVREASVQHRLIAVRLSREGIDVRHDLVGKGDGTLHRMAALSFVRATIKPGVFHIERLDHFNSDPTIDASITAAQANASVGDITVCNDFSGIGAFLDRFVEAMQIASPGRATDTTDGKEPGRQPKKNKKRMSAKEAEEHASAILASQGWPGSLRSLAKRIGCSHELLRRCPSVKPYLDRSPTPVVDENPANLERVTSEEVNPLEQLAFEENLDRMRAGLPLEQRQQIDNMPLDQQRQLVEAWGSQVRDTDDDNRPAFKQRRRKV